jgi:hypothetical protein
MGRIVKPVVIGKKKCNALFDTGASRTYIERGVLPKGTKTIRTRRTQIVEMGGRTHALTEACLLEGEIEGLSFAFTGYPVERIGTAERRHIHLLVGAPTMEEYEIMLNPSKRELDLEGLRRLEFQDF